jgi:DedD protein
LANASQETNVYINSETPDATYTVEKNTGDASAKVTINIPKSGAVAGPAAPAKPAPVAAARPKPAAAKPATAKPAPGRKSDYWVQTGAFSTLGRAEGVKEILSSKGITSIIENRVVDGKTWYRVRVGPYTSETEANYWLALVRSIDGFADSQVRQSVAAR